MSDDLLSQAVRALREETSSPRGARELTRARIMASVRETHRRRMKAVSIVVPLVAVLVVGTALATATGNMPEVWQLLTGGREKVEAPPVATIGAPDRGPRPASEPEVPLEPPVAAVEPEVAEEEEKPTKSSVPVASSKRKDADPQELYRDAHQAHFQRGDCGAAITAYERYLGAAPRGRFAAEASYNRALCLIRVGRTSEARTALQPFAKGLHGGYRRAEAGALLDALDVRDAESGE